MRAESLAHDSVVRRLLARAESTPDAPALRVLAAGGATADATITWGEWCDASTCVAAALVSAGVRQGDRVAILAGNVPLWPIADIGALLAGAIVVGVFPTSSAAQVGETVRDCGARVAIVSGAEQARKLPGSGEPTTIVGDDATSWDAWLARGRAALGDPTIERELARRVAAIGPDDIAGLIYTSGSTGEPKGACVSHAYLLASATSIADALGLVATDSSLSVLPYAHAAERVFGHYTRIVVGMEAGLVADATRVWAAARAFHPTVFGGMPRFYEKAHDALVSARDEATGAEREAWEMLVALGAARSRIVRAGMAVPPEVTASWTRLRPRAERIVATLFGERLRLATSGGAPLPADVAESLDALGVTVLGAYGQTEHLCVAFHRPGDYAFDSVGRPMLGTELRVADDGELLVRRGALTFSGYWQRPAATRDAFTDDGAWLRTGDIGRIDAYGRLVITGRKKELLALSTGKKIAPLPIEGRLAEHPSVAQAVLVGEGRKHVAALLFLRDDANADDASIGAHVERVNATLAPHEQVRRWAPIAAELSEERGELTATGKVRRTTVAARYANEMERLYT